jgi:hypothetical protein
VHPSQGPLHQCVGLAAARRPQQTCRRQHGEGRKAVRGCWLAGWLAVRHTKRAVPSDCLPVLNTSTFESCGRDHANPATHNAFFDLSVCSKVCFSDALECCSTFNCVTQLSHNFDPTVTQLLPYEPSLARALGVHERAVRRGPDPV